MNLGDIKIDKSYQRFMWIACPDCGKERWVRIYKHKPPQSIICHHCNTLRADPTRKKVVILYPIRTQKQAYLQDYSKDFENHFDVAENITYRERIFCLDCPDRSCPGWENCPYRKIAKEEIK